MTERRRRYATPEAAFEARTREQGACLVWTGRADKGGYARFSVGGRMVSVHRWAYEREHGPIPAGMEVDHACWEPSCCRVEHLRLVTPQENSRSRNGAWAGRDLPRNVYRHGSKYQASVWTQGKHHHLGTFDTIEAASDAAERKREELFGIYAGR